MKLLTSPSIVKQLAHLPTRQYPRGQILFYAGDHPSNVYIVRSGAVKIYSHNTRGEEKLLQIATTGSLLPGVCAVGGSDVTFHGYATLCTSDFYVVTLEDFQALIAGSPDLAMACMQQLARDTTILMSRLSSLQKSDTRERLAAALWYLNEHHTSERGNGWRRVNFTVGHQLLADLVGVSRESATLSLKDFASAKACRSPKLAMLEIHPEHLRDFILKQDMKNVLGITES